MDKLRQMLADDMKSGSASSDDDGGGLSIPSGVYGTHDGRLVVMAKSIKRALEKASLAYNESIMNLDYEIVDPGKKGYFGIGGNLAFGTNAPNQDSMLNGLIDELRDMNVAPIPDDIETVFFYR